MSRTQSLPTRTTEKVVASRPVRRIRLEELESRMLLSRRALAAVEIEVTPEIELPLTEAADTDTIEHTITDSIADTGGAAADGSADAELSDEPDGRDSGSDIAAVSPRDDVTSEPADDAPPAVRVLDELPNERTDVVESDRSPGEPVADAAWSDAGDATTLDRSPLGRVRADASVQPTEPTSDGGSGDRGSDSGSAVTRRSLDRTDAPAPAQDDSASVVVVDSSPVAVVETEPAPDTRDDASVREVEPAKVASEPVTVLQPKSDAGSDSITADPAPTETEVLVRRTVVVDVAPPTDSSYDVTATNTALDSSDAVIVVDTRKAAVSPEPATKLDRDPGTGPDIEPITPKPVIVRKLPTRLVVVEATDTGTTPADPEIKTVDAEPLPVTPLLRRIVLEAAPIDEKADDEPEMAVSLGDRINLEQVQSADGVEQLTSGPEELASEVDSKPADGTSRADESAVPGAGDAAPATDVAETDRAVESSSQSVQHVPVSLRPEPTAEGRDAAAAGQEPAGAVGVTLDAIIADEGAGPRIELSAAQTAHAHAPGAGDPLAAVLPDVLLAEAWNDAMRGAARPAEHAGPAPNAAAAGLFVVALTPPLSKLTMPNLTPIADPAAPVPILPVVPRRRRQDRRRAAAGTKDKPDDSDPEFSDDANEPLRRNDFALRSPATVGQSQAAAFDVYESYELAISKLLDSARRDTSAEAQREGGFWMPARSFAAGALAALTAYFTYDRVRKPQAQKPRLRPLTPAYHGPTVAARR